MSKPRLSFWQIWNMSFGFLGIQFGWLADGQHEPDLYLPRRCRRQIAKLWLAAPLTGLIIQPIIGARRSHLGAVGAASALMSRRRDSPVRSRSW